jgi:hypothetical protein
VGKVQMSEFEGRPGVFKSVIGHHVGLALIDIAVDQCQVCKLPQV